MWAVEKLYNKLKFSQGMGSKGLKTLLKFSLRRKGGVSMKNHSQYG